VHALLFAVIDDFLLGQKRMVFDLIHRRYDGGLRQQLFEVLPAIIGHANGLHPLREKQLLHIPVGIHVRAIPDQIAGAVWELGEKRVATCERSALTTSLMLIVCEESPEQRKPTFRIHGNRPVQQPQVDVLEIQALQAQREVFFDTRVVCTPQFGRHENILPLHLAALKGIVEAKTHFILITIAKGGVDMSVTEHDGTLHRMSHPARFRLPRTWEPESVRVQGLNERVREPIKLT
jgi:hypothetical protein